MRAQARSFGWEVETTADDEETRVYFEPVPEITELAPQLEPDTANENVGSYEQHAGVRSYVVDGTWRVPSLAPRPSYSPAIVAMAHRPGPGGGTRTASRPAIGVFVAAVCVLVGIAVGGVLAATGHSRGVVDAAPAKVVMTPSAPAPAAPVVTPIEEIALPVPGATPVAAAAIAPVAPTPTAAVVAAPAPVAAPLPAPQPTFVPQHHHHAAPAEAPAASGKLAVSSKPPCSIIIDGKDTGLVAPQRAIELAAGKHEITLVNAEQGIHLTAEVAITADRSTQLIRDFTN